MTQFTFLRSIDHTPYRSIDRSIACRAGEKEKRRQRACVKEVGRRRRVLLHSIVARLGAPPGPPLQAGVPVVDLFCL